MEQAQKRSGQVPYVSRRCLKFKEDSKSWRKKEQYDLSPWCHSKPAWHKINFWEDYPFKILIISVQKKSTLPNVNKFSKTN